MFQSSFNSILSLSVKGFYLNTIFSVIDFHLAQKSVKLYILSHTKKKSCFHWKSHFTAHSLLLFCFATVVVFCFVLQIILKMKHRVVYQGIKNYLQNTLCKLKKKIKLFIFCNNSTELLIPQQHVKNTEYNFQKRLFWRLHSVELRITSLYLNRTLGGGVGGWRDWE